MQMFATALGGMTGAEMRLENTARRLATVDEPVREVDPSSEMVALIESRNDFAANAQALKTGDKMQEALLDILT